jgi:radical SAM protein with 4Fe4S-binding SPASM domain
MPHTDKQMISFFLTTKCNLCCSYCYNAEERAKVKEQTMSLKIAKAGLNWYFANCSSRHIRFYGPGEPTCEFESMKSIVEYARQISGNAVTTEIQTNGIFGNEVRQWILENLNIVWLSFDGLPSIQNNSRPLNRKHAKEFGDRTSAEIIEDTVKWFRQNKDNRNIMVGARVTMTNDNISEQKAMVDYFYNLGIRYVWTDALFPSVCRVPYKDDPKRQASYKFDMDKYIDYYIEANKYAESKCLFWGNFLAINFDGESPYHCRACLPLKAPHITTDGYLSACDLVLLGEETYHMEPFIFGKYNDEKLIFDLYDDRIKALQNRIVQNIPHCSSCEAKYYCGGYCLGEVLNETGCLNGQKHMACKATKRLFKELGVCRPYKYKHP